MYSFPLHSSRIYLLDIGFLIGSSFLLGLEIHWAISGSLDSDEKYAVILIVFLWIKCHFSLAAFKVFSTYLVFRSLITMCHCIHLFGFIVSELYSGSSIYRFLSPAKSGEFSVIISLSTFSALPSFSSPFRRIMI